MQKIVAVQIHLGLVEFVVLVNNCNGLRIVCVNVLDQNPKPPSFYTDVDNAGGNAIQEKYTQDHLYTFYPLADALLQMRTWEKKVQRSKPQHLDSVR